MRSKHDQLVTILRTAMRIRQLGVLVPQKKFHDLLRTNYEFTREEYRAAHAEATIAFMRLSCQPNCIPAGDADPQLVFDPIFDAGFFDIADGI